MVTKSRVEEDGCNGGRDAQRRDAPSHPVDTLQAIRQRRQWTERSERRHDLRFCKIMLEHTGSRTSEMYMPEPQNESRQKETRASLMRSDDIVDGRWEQQDNIDSLT